MDYAVHVVASHDDPSYRIELRSDGILCYRAARGVTFTAPMARRILADGVAMIESPRPCLVLMQDAARAERDARAIFASEDYLALASHTALVVGSPVSRVVGNFFVGLNPPKYAIRIFTDADKAIDWLRACTSCS